MNSYVELGFLKIGGIAHAKLWCIEVFSALSGGVFRGPGIFISTLVIGTRFRGR